MSTTNKAFINEYSGVMCWLPHDNIDFVALFSNFKVTVFTAYSSRVGIDTRSPKSQMRGIILLSDENVTFARSLFIIARRRSNDTTTKVYIELVITNTGQKFTILQRMSPEKKH
jgi:hypothetical protein